jgi:hypothetical protein
MGGASFSNDRAAAELAQRGVRKQKEDSDSDF